MKQQVKKIPVISRPMSIFMVLCVLICIVVLIYTVSCMINSQYKFNESVNEIEETTRAFVFDVNTKALNSKGNDIESMEAFLDDTKVHLENMATLVKLQQDISSSNIASLIYTFISTILLVVAIYLVKDIEEKHLGIIESINKQEDRVSEFPLLIQTTSLYFLHIQRLDYIGLFLCQEHAFSEDGTVRNSLIVRARDNFDDIEFLINQDGKNMPAYVSKEIINSLEWFEQRVTMAYSSNNIDESVQNELFGRIKVMVTKLEVIYNQVKVE